MSTKIPPMDTASWRRCGGPACGLLLLVLVGCGRDRATWTPVPEETSTIALRTEVQEAAERLESVRSLLLIDPARAEESLISAQQSLHRLLDYYLPVVDARTRAYDAYRLCYLGELNAAAGELDRIEAVLLEVASRGGPHLGPEIARRLELVSDARVAITATPGDAPAMLKKLALELNSMVVKGRLILPGREGADAVERPAEKG